MILHRFDLSHEVSYFLFRPSLVFLKAFTTSSKFNSFSSIILYSLPIFLREWASEVLIKVLVSSSDSWDAIPVSALKPNSIEGIFSREAESKIFMQAISAIAVESLVRCKNMSWYKKIPPQGIYYIKKLLSWQPANSGIVFQVGHMSVHSPWKFPDLRRILGKTVREWACTPLFAWSQSLTPAKLLNLHL